MNMSVTNSVKTVIVTGANCGIGYAVACKLCTEGYDVILACRNKEKGEEAAAQIKYSQPKALATFLQVDLSDFNSVRSFVENYRKLDKHLYALLNNAGLAMPFADTKRQTNPEGLEITMVSNYYGHFLLTNLLLEDLKKGAEQFGEARVVGVTSSLHVPKNAKSALRGKDLTITEIEFDNMDLEKEGTYSGIQAYKNSKSAVIMFMSELSRKLEGANVATSSVSPGFIPTTYLCRNSGYVATFFMHYVLPTMAWLTGKKFVVSLEEGSQRVTNTVIAEDCKGVTGKYYQDGVESTPQGDTLDTEKQKQLWDKTMEIVGLLPVQSATAV